MLWGYHTYVTVGEEAGPVGSLLCGYWQNPVKEDPVTRQMTLHQLAQFRRRAVLDARRSRNISQAAKQHRITRQTLHRWIRRYDGTLESLKDHSRRPSGHPRQHTPTEIDQIKRYFSHNQKLGLVCFWVHIRQKMNYRRSVSALYRLLRRLELIPPPKKRQRKKPKPYEPILLPGERFQMDVKHVPPRSLIGGRARQRLYQFTAIDECTRWRYACIFNELSTYNAVRFTRQLLKHFPFEIQCIQTDNGSEFTSRLQGAAHPSAFEAFLEEQGIQHKRIAVATPRHNGKVERSHRCDQERFYEGNTFFSLPQLNRQFQRYIRESNRMPLQAHGWKSATQKLQEFRDVL